ncbi:MAG TPA: NAD(P)H-dependent oxidoreductase [Streptomyces sp.]|nr:NAD(P)H-dependent oxidoreductase [Streptomyces sp.]
MTEAPLRLAVIVGSVRGGRFGLPVAHWFAEEARRFGSFEVDVLDLAELPLPMAMPELGQEPDAETAAVWERISQRLHSADAFALVTPEYNHSYPASLKNVLDWFRPEWTAKAFGLVSYGGQGGGIRAAEHLRQVISELHSVSVRDAMSFHNAWDLFDEDAKVKDAGESAAAAKVMLAQLEWWAAILRAGRGSRPYPG